MSAPIPVPGTPSAAPAGAPGQPINGKPLPPSSMDSEAINHVSSVADLRRIAGDLEVTLEAALIETAGLIAENERLTLLLNQIERSCLAAGQLRGELVYVASAYTQAFEMIAMLCHQREPVAAPQQVSRPAQDDADQDDAEEMKIISVEEDFRNLFREFNQERQRRVAIEGQADQRAQKLRNIHKWALEASRMHVVCSGKACQAWRDTLRTIERVTREAPESQEIPF